MAVLSLISNTGLFFCHLQTIYNNCLAVIDNIQGCHCEMLKCILSEDISIKLLGKIHLKLKDMMQRIHAEISNTNELCRQGISIHITILLTLCNLLIYQVI